MIPESFMPALRNGVAGFLIAITSVVVPFTAVLHEHRPSTFREASSSRDISQVAPHFEQEKNLRHTLLKLVTLTVKLTHYTTSMRDMLIEI